MFAVVFRILLRAAFTLLLLTACVFFGLHMTGDPARIMLGNAADEVALEAFRAPYDLEAMDLTARLLMLPFELAQ